MAENQRCDHANLQPTLITKLMALPFVNGLLNLVLRIYIHTKIVNVCVKVVLNTVGFIPKTAVQLMSYLVTPILNVMGVWEMLASLANRGLAFIEKMVQNALGAVQEAATDSKQKIDNFIKDCIAALRLNSFKVAFLGILEALHIRLNIIIKSLRGCPCRQMVTRSTSGLLNKMHAILDFHSPEPEHDRKDVDTMDNHTKATSLPIKARKILLESKESKVTLRGEPSEEQRLITNIEMVKLGQRRTSFLYENVVDQPSISVLLFTIIASLVSISAILAEKLVQKIWRCLKQAIKGIVEALTPME